MIERDVTPIIDSAISKAERKYDSIRDRIKQEQLEEERAKELEERKEKQLRRISRLVGMRVGTIAKETKVFEPLKYAQEKLGGVPGAEIHDVNFVWNSSNQGNLGFNGYAGTLLCVGTLTPKKYPYSKMRLASYGGFFVVEGINPNGSDSQVESEIDGRLRFWHGRIYDSSREVTSPDQEKIKREKKALLDSNLSRLRKKIIFNDWFRLYSDALPVYSGGGAAEVINFTHGLADFVRTVYIPPDFRQKAAK